MSNISDGAIIAACFVFVYLLFVVIMATLGVA